MLVGERVLFSDSVALIFQYCSGICHPELRRLDVLLGSSKMVCFLLVSL